MLLLFTVAFALTVHEQELSYTETGTASHYARSLEGNLTASGEIYYHDSLTAAHRTLPFGTILEVENLENGKSVIVKVNDRGPFSRKRIIDLSGAAFKELAPMEKGLIKVKVMEISR